MPLTTMENPYTQNGSPYPTPNWGAAGVNLGTALFGNPQMAAQQAYLRAQAQNQMGDAAMRQADAQRFQAEAANTADQVAAKAKLPDLFRGAYSGGDTVPATPDVPAMAGPAVSTGIGSDEPTGALLSTPAVPGTPAYTTPRTVDANGLGALMAGMIQGGLKGEEAKAYLANLEAFAGNDPDARRALIAQGQTPGEAFATTDADAQAIAKAKTDAAYKQELDGRNATGLWDLKGHQVAAGAELGAAKIHAGAEEYGANKQYAASTQDTNTRDATERWKIGQGVGQGPAPSVKDVLTETTRQLGPAASTLSAPTINAIAAQATDLARGHGNVVSAVQQAIAAHTVTQHNPGLWGFGASDKVVDRPAAGGWSAKRVQ